MNKSPIFIHSLFRAGSTYLFNVFRRSPAGYWCYQEALHELVALACNEPEKLLSDLGDDAMRMYRHPQMGEAYFQELYKTWPSWKETFNESAVFEGYFASPNHDFGILYWNSLIEAAKGKPVFQECRTSGRIHEIKKKLGGYHIYLWRNPWDQWWSYKITPYFDIANQLIINASNAPPAVKVMLDALCIEPYPINDTADAIAHFSARPLTSENSYLVFYMLWCLGLQQGIKQTHLLLNIDKLSNSSSYQADMQKHLVDVGIDGIDFSDCNVPQGIYLDEDKAFFITLEDMVHNWLVSGGWSLIEINNIRSLRHEFEPSGWSKDIGGLNPANLAEQATRARTLTRRFETNAAAISSKSVAKVAHLEWQLNAKPETRAEEAETRAEEAETRAEEAETRAEEAEIRAIQLQNELDAVHAANHHHWQLAEAQAQRIALIYQSSSWRITAPLRRLGLVASHLTSNAIKPRIKVLLEHGAFYFRRRPRLKNAVLKGLHRFPALKSRVFRVVSCRSKPIVTHDSVPINIPHLSQRAREIYANLNAANERRKEDR